MTPEIIDVHCHVVSPDRARYPLAPIGGKQSDWSSERPTTPEDMIAAMDAAGVAKAAVVQASTAYGHDSSYLADSIARFPQRFTGVFSVDPLDAGATRHMDHWRGRGMTGLRVFTTGSTMPGQQTWLDDERAYAVWEKAGADGLPVAMQMTAQALPALAKIAERFPRTQFLFDHLARPVINDGPPYAAAASLWEIARLPNIFLKLTSRPIEHMRQGLATPETFLPKLLSHYRGRILWGSNWPAHDATLPHIVEEALTTLTSLSADDRADILSGAAKRLYPTLA